MIRCVPFSRFTQQFLDVRASEVVELLNERNIKVTSVDFVRFTWLDKELDREIEEELQEEDGEDEVEVDYDAIPPIKPVEYGIRHFTNPTIWIGVLPDTLPGAAAHEAAKDIRAFLDGPGRKHRHRVSGDDRQALVRPWTNSFCAR